MRTILVAILPLALLAPATAEHCATWSTSDATLDTGVAEGTPRAYVAYVEFPFSIYVYAESNGIDGLQRGDEVVDNTCHGMIPADEIYF